MEVEVKEIKYEYLQNWEKIIIHDLDEPENGLIVQNCRRFICYNGELHRERAYISILDSNYKLIRMENICDITLKNIKCKKLEIITHPHMMIGAESQSMRHTVVDLENCDIEEVHVWNCNIKIKQRKSDHIIRKIVNKDELCIYQLYLHHKHPTITIEGDLRKTAIFLKQEQKDKLKFIHVSKDWNDNYVWKNTPRKLRPLFKLIKLAVLMPDGIKKNDFKNVNIWEDFKEFIKAHNGEYPQNLGEVCVK